MRGRPGSLERAGVAGLRRASALLVPKVPTPPPPYPCGTCGRPTPEVPFGRPREFCEASACRLLRKWLDAATRELVRLHFAEGDVGDDKRRALRSELFQLANLIDPVTTRDAAGRFAGGDA